MKVLANDGISASGKEKLEAAGFTVVTETVEQSNLISAINEEGYEVILVRSATKIRKDIFDTCPGIKMVGRGGVGMDNIDVAYGRDKGVNVFNTPAASSQAVAELAIGHMLSIARGIYNSNRNMPAKGNSDFKVLKKKYGKGTELRGKTLGVIGFGRIGQFTAKYALGLGMNIVACNKEVITAEIDLEIPNVDAKVSITTTSLDEVLAQSDFISLHIPAQADGSAVIGKAEFERMKDGVRIINLARGGVIDESALIEALDNGKVSHAALDVFVGEPTPREDILAHEKISLTPHIGAATVEAQDRIGTELADTIINYYKEALENA